MKAVLEHAEVHCVWGGIFFFFFMHVGRLNRIALTVDAYIN